MKKHLNTWILVVGKFSKIFKSLKLLKIGLSIASMIVFGFIQSAAMGVAMGVSLMVLLLLHEIGHTIALHQKGYGLKLPMFIPMVGAVIAAPRMEDRNTEAYVGYGGPLLGTICALLFAIPYLFTHNQLWLSGAFVGLAINLFNMIPISPFDGGRVTQAVDPRLRYIGYALLMLLTIATKDASMLLLWILVIGDFESPTVLEGRFAVGIFCAMTIAFIFDLGTHEPWGLKSWDVLLGVFISFGTYFKSRHIAKLRLALERLGELEDEPEPRRNLSTDEKFKWFYLWASLLVIQIVCCIHLFNLIKKP